MPRTSAEIVCCACPPHNDVGGRPLVGASRRASQPEAGAPPVLLVYEDEEDALYEHRAMDLLLDLADPAGVVSLQMPEGSRAPLDASADTGTTIVGYLRHSPTLPITTGEATPPTSEIPFRLLAPGHAGRLAHRLHVRGGTSRHRLPGSLCRPLGCGTATVTISGPTSRGPSIPCACGLLDTTQARLAPDANLRLRFVTASCGGCHGTSTPPESLVRQGPAHRIPRLAANLNGTAQWHLSESYSTAQTVTYSNPSSGVFLAVY